MDASRLGLLPRSGPGLPYSSPAAPRLAWPMVAEVGDRPPALIVESDARRSRDERRRAPSTAFFHVIASDRVLQATRCILVLRPSLAQICISNPLAVSIGPRSLTTIEISTVTPCGKLSTSTSSPGEEDSRSELSDSGPADLLALRRFRRRIRMELCRAASAVAACVVSQAHPSLYQKCDSYTEYSRLYTLMFD